jgi:hypothetical protein
MVIGSWASLHTRKKNGERKKEKKKREREREKKMVDSDAAAMV